MVKVWLGLIILVISACVRDDRPPTYVIPKSDRFLGVVPYDKLKPRAYQRQIYTNTPGDPKDSYANGYQAGCQTMNSAVGTGFARMKGPTLDPDKLTQDAWYLRGYEDGATACTFVLDWELH